jgi:hypothetical protein
MERVASERLARFTNLEYDASAMVARIATIATVIINSISVNPDCEVRSGRM